MRKCHYCDKPYDGIYGYIDPRVTLPEVKIDVFALDLVHAHRECLEKEAEFAEETTKTLERRSQEGADPRQLALFEDGEGQ